MEIIEMIKYSVPALIVFFTAFFMMRYYMQKEARERKVDLVIRNQQTITPSGCRLMNAWPFSWKGSIRNPC